MANIRTQTGSFAYAKYQLRRCILEKALQRACTIEDYDAALRHFGGCAFCGATPAPRKDHLVAVINCGDFIRSNVVPACQVCDDSKGQRDYRDWMRDSNSRRSLKARGFTSTQIEARIKLIQGWQAGYKPKTEAELFGEDHTEYEQILETMAKLCEQASRLAHRVRNRSNRHPIERTNHTSVAATLETNADRIRHFIIERYVRPAQKRGDKTVTIRAGDVHSQMSLHGQHANVCQVMRGQKFLSLAGIQLSSHRGTPAGAESFFSYEIGGN